MRLQKKSLIFQRSSSFHIRKWSFLCASLSTWEELVGKRNFFLDQQSHLTNEEKLKESRKKIVRPICNLTWQDCSHGNISKNRIGTHCSEHSMAMGNLNKSKETMQTATTAIKVASRGLHAIWSYKEQSYKEPALRFWKKIKNQPWEFWT